MIITLWLQDADSPNFATEGIAEAIMFLHPSARLVDEVEFAPWLQKAGSLPLNMATEGIAEAIAVGAREGGGEGSAVLMIVQPGERNSYDQQVWAFGKSIVVQCG